MTIEKNINIISHDVQIHRQVAVLEKGEEVNKMVLMY